MTRYIICRPTYVAASVCIACDRITRNKHAATACPHSSGSRLISHVKEHANEHSRQRTVAWWCVLCIRSIQGLAWNWGALGERRRGSTPKHRIQSICANDAPLKESGSPINEQKKGYDHLSTPPNPQVRQQHTLGMVRVSVSPSRRGARHQSHQALALSSV
jgi:hypothetical protein